MITPEQFATLLPLAAIWAEEQEEIILREGVQLSETQMTDARKIGVSQAELIRLLRVQRIPLPENPALAEAAHSTQLITPATVGLTLRYGILIRDDCWGQRQLLAHELVHTSQYERLGGFLPFLRKYLNECITIGYPAAPMEQEAVSRAAELIGI